MLANETLHSKYKNSYTSSEMIDILFDELGQLRKRNNTLESRVSELEKHVFEF